ncbi:MAG: putative signal transducing protein [Anaerolineae bacterium]
MAGELGQHQDSTVVVYIASSPTLAEIVRAKLESYGIPAALQYQSAGRVLGLYINGWGETRVLVPAERAQEARELLAEELFTDLGPDEDSGLDEGAG